VPIPLGKACEWAYTGQSNGAYSGSAYSIVCLARTARSSAGSAARIASQLGARIPVITDGTHLADATMLKGIWVCAK